MPRRLIFPKRGEVSFEVFEPQPVGATEVYVRTLYSLMSIGTETTILNQRYDPDTHFARMFSFPQLQTGVQSVGEVLAAGAEVEEFAPRDIVYMRQGHGSHHVVPAANCSPVPDGVDLEAACWCGLAKTAFRAAWEGRFRRGGKLLIIGAGPVGQMAIRWAASAGVEVIAVADLAAARLEHARRGGASLILNGDVSQCAQDIRAIDDGKGPSIVVDSTGNPAVFRHALAVAAKFGKVILLGDTGYPSQQCLTSDVMVKGLTIVATHDSHERDGWTERRVDRLFFDLVRQGSFDLEGLISDEFSPEDYPQAYALANERREQAMGILFDWTGKEW